MCDHTAMGSCDPSGLRYHSLVVDSWMWHYSNWFSVKYLSKHWNQLSINTE